MQALLKITRRHQFTMLLVVLLLNILLLPAFMSLSSEHFPNIGLIVASALFTLLMLTAIVVTSTNRLIIILAISLILPDLILLWARHELLENEWRFILRNSLDVAILSLVTISILKYIFSAKIVSFDYINAALCVYLILGILWVSLYSIAESIQPGSFHLPDDGLVDFIGQSADADTFVRRIYFSFVTLLTLGYGDMVPINSIARLLAIMEALIGQIFLVVLVARLVGIQVSQSLEK